jgi:3-hydroxyisobutyrate dehydrogenase-like beta-hydroxyacid dehydrogenase
MGQRVFVLGEQPPSANVVKLAGNFLITAAIEGLAEATTVVAKGGVDRTQFLDIMLGTLFDAPVYRGYAKILLEERFSPTGFALPLGLKDNRLPLQAGDQLAAPLPLASLIHDRMLAALARGYCDLDWSAFARIPAEEAGLADGHGQAQP